MIDLLRQHIDTVARGLTDFDSKTSLVADGPIGRFVSVPAPADSRAARELFLWQLLSTNDDDAVRRYLAQMDGHPLSELVTELPRILSRGDVAVRVSASGLVLPSLVLRRPDRPIVLRGATLDLSPRRLLADVSLESRCETVAADCAAGATRVAVPVDRAAEPSVDDRTRDLAAALITCLAEDKACPPPARRSGKQRSLSETRFWGKQKSWTVAAALAAMAAIFAYADWPGSRGPSVTIADVAAPVARQLARIKPDARIDVVAPQPAEAAHVWQGPVAPPPPAPVETASQSAPVPVPTVKVADAPAAAIAAEEPGRRETDRANAAPVPAANAASRPAVVVRAAKSDATQPVSHAATPLPDKPAVASAAKHRTKKAIIAKRTNVASALVLPDVLKPQ